MTELPYTYTDRDGAELRIGRGYCTASDRTNHKTVSVNTPTGEDAVALAHTVLAAAGDTGHEVVEEGLVSRSLRSAEEEGARSMRERIADAMEVEYGLLAARMVETMPLLPDEDTAGHEGEHHALKGSVTWQDGLASRVTELEALVTDQANALEGHSRAIADLREQMSSAQAAIRGLGQSITPTTVEDDQ